MGATTPDLDRVRALAAFELFAFEHRAYSHGGDGAAASWERCQERIAELRAELPACWWDDPELNSAYRTAERAYAVDLYERIGGAAKIAANLGVAAATVRTWAYRAGKRSPRQISMTDFERVALAQAARSGGSRSVVREALRRPSSTPAELEGGEAA